MFFELARRNSKRSRKENGLFFGSLILSVIAFYVILSLEKQDVMIFLRAMESDAVRRLLALLPAVYAATLCLLFFLVYFASRYQMERRSHEFGVYLMMGMNRSRLLFLLLLEDIWSSLCALLAGIPAAVALSEIVSLITARIAGLGIIGHQFAFSIKAAIITGIGFAGVKLLASAMLSYKTVKKEPEALLNDTQEQKNTGIHMGKSMAALACGVILLGSAYGMAICGMAWQRVSMMGLTMLTGIGGMFLFFHGLGSLMEVLLRKPGKRRQKDNGLRTFTFRQIQENVCNRPGTLATASLLILAALCCFGFGVSMSRFAAGQEDHVIDVTFDAEEAEVEEALSVPELSGYFADVFEIRASMLYTGEHPSVEEGEAHTLDAASLIECVAAQRDSKERSVLLNNLEYFSSPYLIPQSDYNQILKQKGEEPLALRENQIALYDDPGLMNEGQKAVMEQALSDGPVIRIDNAGYQLQDKLYHDSIVVDQFVTIQHGLIVPDELYERLMEGKETEMSFFNGVLEKEIVKEEGLMQTIFHIDTILKDSGLRYETFLQNMGRQLFYAVAYCYLGIYLAVIFLIIANTMIGVQFLMQLQKMGRRYRTLISMGSTYGALKHSSRTQIKWYFGLPVGVAAISSIFGMWALFTGLLSESMYDHIFFLAGIAAAVIGVLCVIEYMYISSVMRTSDRHIWKMMQMERIE